MIDPWLVESQRELELEAIDLGINRYRLWRERGDLGAPEQQLVGMALTYVAQSIQSVKDRVVSEELRAGPGFLDWAPVITYFPADMLAGAALMAVMSSVLRSPDKTPSRQAVVMAIGGAVETMFHLLKAKEMDRDLYNILRRTIKHWDGRRARRFYRKVTGMNRAFVMRERSSIGAFLLSHVLTTNWFQVEKVGKRETWKLSMDPEVSGHLAKQHEQLELLSPMLYPSVAPLEDWNEGGKGGGYLYHKHDLFKPVNLGDRAPKFEGSPIVIQAVNAVQRTAFAVNRNVLEVQENLWRSGGGVAGLCRLEPIDVEREEPRREGESEEMLRARKERRAEIHRANALDAGLRLEQLWRLKAAKTMARYPAFYHSWQLDWRGRIYPKSTVLHPQGGDLDRGLITFAKAMKQTEDGRRWLAIHLANCWANDGIDKEPYSVRVEWVNQQEKLIRATVANPYDNQWWQQAENPWMFLAACFEWCREDGLTQLPVAIDGTCNGLQHYSAIGLDAIGGLAVNLVPGPRPRDIYNDVATEMKAALSRRTSFEVVRMVKDGGGVKSVRQTIPRPWLPEITRKVAKRGVMTYPYGLTHVGMLKQFIEDGWVEGSDDPFASASALRDLLTEGIGKVVVKAVEYMDWIKGVAAEFNKVGKAWSWTVPSTGLRVTQDYVIPNYQQLSLPGLGRLRFEVYSDAERELNKLKQLNGSCPNIIHSFDAAHLMLTVRAAVTAGITDFWLVHDSYGCHAPLVPTLGRVLREEFVGMYKENPLERIKEEAEAQLGANLPSLPERGTLDLEGVLESEYAWS